MKIVIITICTLLITGCGVPEADHKKLIKEIEFLKQTNEKLASDLDEALNGEERIIGLITNAYKSKEYQKAKKHIKQLADKHPYSLKNEEFKLLSIKIDKEIALIQKKEAEAEKERVRLANLNNTGKWEIKQYTDEWGDPAKYHYIKYTNKRNTGWYHSKFRHHSPLKVVLIIHSPSYAKNSLAEEISFRCFEDDNHNYVKKGDDSEMYEARISHKGQKLALSGHFNINGLSLSSIFSDQHQKFFELLKTGGLIMCNFVERDVRESQYSFYIESDYFENAYRLLLEKEKEF